MEKLLHLFRFDRLIFLKPNSFKNQNFYLPAAQESTAKPALSKNWTITEAVDYFATRMDLTLPVMNPPTL